MEVVEGWWQWPITDFSGQIRQFCPGCGIPARIPGTRDADEIDTFTASNRDIVANAVKHGRKVIETHIPRLIPVVEEEANRFGCNAVVVGRTVVTNTGCEKLTSSLRDWRYTPIAVELDEFLKAGGSAKCLTLRLDGEEAATWAR